MNEKKDFLRKEILIINDTSIMHYNRSRRGYRQDPDTSDEEKNYIETMVWSTQVINNNPYYSEAHWRNLTIGSKVKEELINEPLKELEGYTYLYEPIDQEKYLNKLTESLTVSGDRYNRDRDPYRFLYPNKENHPKHILRLTKLNKWKDNNVVCFSKFPKEVFKNLPYYDLSQFNITEGLGQVSHSLTSCNDNLSLHFSFIKSKSINSFIENTNQRIKMFDLKRLCRGSGIVESTFKDKNSSAWSKGYKIALCKFTSKFYNVEEKEIQNCHIYTVICNASINTYHKYKKCCAYINNFIKKINRHNGAYFYDKETYQTLVEKQFGKNSIYWNKHMDLFSSSDYQLEKIKLNTHVVETKFQKQHFNIFSEIKRINISNEYRQYSKIAIVASEMETKITSLTNSQSNIDYRISNASTSLESLEARIEGTKKEIKVLEKEKVEITKDLPGYKVAIVNINKELETKKENYRLYIENIEPEDSVSSNSYLKNFRNKGIIIDDIIYHCYETGTRRSISEDSSLAIKAKISILETDTDNKVTLDEVHFRIVKPVIIRVDYGEKGENCKKVVGGPYVVRATPNSLSIGLLSTASVFGINNSQLYIHPHVSAIGIDLNNPNYFFQSIIGNRRQACLGEASSGIYNAFQACDVRQIILAAMTWITNANSSDTWGKNYKYFPIPAQIKLEGNEITKDYLQKQNIEEELTKEDGIFNLVADTIDIEDEEIDADETIDEELLDNVTEVINNLRTPGIPGYMPVYGTETQRGNS